MPTEVERVGGEAAHPTGMQHAPRLDNVTKSRIYFRILNGLSLKRGGNGTHTTGQEGQTG